MSLHSFKSHYAKGLLWLGFAAAAPVWAGSTLNYSVSSISGNVQGAMAVAIDHNERRVKYWYTDRGRGPEVTSHMTTSAAHLPTSIEAQGLTYLKVPFRESYVLASGVGKWTSVVGPGQSKARGFYILHDGTPDSLTVLAQALLSAPAGTLALLPVGSAHIEKVKDYEIGCAAQTEPITLYLIQGLDFGATPIWLDRSGELFFQGDEWVKVSRKGRETCLGQLLQLQKEAMRSREVQEAARLARAPAGPVVFQNVTLYDSTSQQALQHRTVIVHGSRIESVGEASLVRAPMGAEVIDGTGKTLIPGLFDMHVHLGADADGALAIASGVTSVRDMANDLDELRAWRIAFDSGRLIGPRVFMAGMVDGRGPYAGPTKLFVDTPEEVRAVINKLHDYGYPQVKIYSSVKPALVPIIIKEAHARGMRVSGHIPAGMTMEQAVEEGYDEVQHANFWLLNFMGPEITAKTNTMVRITAIGEHGRDVDLNSDKVNRFIALLQAHHTVLDPTLTIYDDSVAETVGQPPSSVAAVIQRLPPTVAQSLVATGVAHSPAELARAHESLNRLHQFFLKMYRAGITMVAGTDFIPGLALPRELEVYVESGLTPCQALYLATLSSAKVAGAADRLGSIEPGKLADLALIDGDPTQNISDLRKTEIVMKNGVMYDSAAVYALVGVKPFQK